MYLGFLESREARKDFSLRDRLCRFRKRCERVVIVFVADMTFHVTCQRYALFSDV